MLASRITLILANIVLCQQHFSLISERAPKPVILIIDCKSIKYQIKKESIGVTLCSHTCYAGSFSTVASTAETVAVLATAIR